MPVFAFSKEKSCFSFFPFFVAFCSIDFQEQQQQVRTIPLQWGKRRQSAPPIISEVPFLV